MEQYDETKALPELLVTAVGSMPHGDRDAAVDLIFDTFSASPHAPQLSRMDLREQMWIQFTEGLPRFEIDPEEQRYWFDTSGDTTSELEEFYTAYLAVMEGESADRFAIGPEYGGSILRCLERLKSSGKKYPYFKVQVTGPLSFAMTVPDEEGKPIFYHPSFRDVAVKGMGLKAVWLIEQFQPYADNIVVFFDEPSMSAYGSSAFMGVSETDVVESLDDVISMVVQRGGIPGVHCCGNTDWGILMKTTTRIINFDAVDYMETMGIYPQLLNDFLSKGGVLAWGAVPNTELAGEESADIVADRIRRGVEYLAGNGVDVDLLQSRVIVTPACGCAGLTVDRVNDVYAILRDLDAKGSAALRSA